MIPAVQCKAYRFQTLLLEQYTLAPHFSRALPKHVHEQYQISLSLTDPCRHRYRGANHAAPVGVVSILHPREVHSSPDLLISPNASVFYILYVPPEAMQTVAADRIGRAASEPFFADPVLRDAALADRFRQLWRCLTRAAPQLEQDSMVLSTLARMIARHAPNGLGSAGKSPSRRSLSVARDYLHAHAAENLTLERMSGIAGLSPAHFCRAFQAQFGMPPHAYQIKVRIDRAKVLISQGVAVGDAAFSVGFYGSSHFGWHFKRLVGISPGAYARQSLFTTISTTIS